MYRMKYFLCLFFSISFVAHVVRAMQSAQPESPRRYALSSNPYYEDGELAKYSHLTPEQLLDTAKYYGIKNEYNTAFTCYSFIINTVEADDDAGLQRLKIEALNNSAIIYYYWMSDYVKAYKLLTDALELCGMYPNKEAEFKIYNNIGNIYSYLDEHEMAGKYYSDALKICTDSVGIMLLHNNIADAQMTNGDLDSALLHINKSLDISRRYSTTQLSTILNTAASIYREKGMFDSALRYYESALDDARKNDRIEYEVEILSGMGKLFFETGRPEEAGRYIESSNAIAKENNLNNILQENYLLISQMGYSSGDYKKAMEHLARYNGLRDSLFSADKLANIDQLQRLGEMSKANHKIEQMSVEQKIKERTIGYQKIILVIAFAVLLLVAAVLLFVWRQKRRLNSAYRTLVSKNIEIMALQEASSQKECPKSANYDNDGELLDRILAIMEDTEIICSPKFSINVLASLVHANHVYVSQVINATLNKNFRSLLNSYRIREAQRIFSESSAVKYTIESVSLQLGYKSQNTFRTAFQEITGVSPSFYLKSLPDPPKQS